MSLLKSNSVQIGQSTTGTNNFTLSVPSSPDGTIKLARGNSGATTADVLTVNASGAITGATISGATINSSTVNGGSITSGTSQASTSGTAIDFTGIPSWVKRVTVSISGVSTNGASNLRFRIGPVAGVETSGYLGATTGFGTTTLSSVQFTDGFDLNDGASSGATRNGVFIISLLDSSTNLWSFAGTMGQSNSVNTCLVGGSKPLAGVLSVVRMTTVNGTDTFDAGSINILYEG